MSTAAQATSRSVAAEALVELEGDAEYADEVLSRHLNQSGLRGSDRSLAADLFWGTTRWRARLDAVIAPVFHGDYGRAGTLIRVLLRMGAYQVFCQDRIPDHAAVSQTVQVAVNKLNPPAAGLVNAVLRRLARERERWTTLPDGADEVAVLAFLHSHPRWIVRELLGRFGPEECARALEANNSRAPLTVCVNPLRYSNEELLHFLGVRQVAVEPSALLDGYFRLHTASLHQIQTLLDSGRLTVQDESAGLAVELLSPAPGERVLDMCAAPGGKLIAMYQRMKGEGQLVAVEISPERAEQLNANLNRVGAKGVEVIVADARTFGASLFDKILVDAPCSALGLLRKQPDVRWRRKSHHLAAHTKTQSELLSRAGELLKPGGVIVYSTCSILPAENHDIVNQMLHAFPEYHKEDARAFLPEAVIGVHGDLETFTHVHDTDGAFASRLRRSLHS